MGHNNYLDELIVSFFAHELNSEEEAFVLQWVNSSEENKQHFEELRYTWDLLSAEQTVKDVDVDTEWTRFRHSISGVPAETSVLTYQPPADQEEVLPVKKSAFRQLLMTTAVAASLLLMIGLGWETFRGKEPLKITSPLAKTIKQGSKISIVRRVNTTNKIQLITLPDSSLVKLYSNSEISYSDPFPAGKRDVRLLGMAQFKVEKDKTRPFVVYSGAISTTALGTRFTVTAYPIARNIAVRLYEGKVVVKSTNDAKARLDKDFFLKPGQEFIYDTWNLTAMVRSHKLEDYVSSKDADKKESSITDNPTIPRNGKGNWYMFNNQPLSQVFTQLEGMYNIDIVYSKKELSKIYFIGTFNVTDSLNEILQQIADLNNLEVIKKNNKVVISKK